MRGSFETALAVLETSCGPERRTVMARTRLDVNKRVNLYYCSIKGLGYDDEIQQ